MKEERRQQKKTKQNKRRYRRKKEEKRLKKRRNREIEEAKDTCSDIQPRDKVFMGDGVRMLWAFGFTPDEAEAGANMISERGCFESFFFVFVLIFVM